MPNKVFEGSAELNIQKFLDGLRDLETAATLTAVNVATIFQSLDVNVSKSLSGFQGHLQGIAQQLTGIGGTLKGSNEALAQGQQQQSTAIKNTGSLLAQQQQANAQVVQAGFATELATRKTFNQEDERLLKDRIARDLQALKTQAAAEASLLATAYAQQRATIEQQLAQTQSLRAAAQQSQQDALGEKVNLLGSGPVPADLAQRLDGVKQNYQASANAARLAEQEEASLQRQLTQVIDTERKAQFAVQDKFNKDSATAASVAAKDIAAATKAASSVALQQQRADAGVLAADERARSQQQQAAIRADAQVVQTGFQQQLNAQKQSEQQREASLKAHIANDLQQLKIATVAEATVLEDGYAKQRVLLEKELTDAARLKAEALQKQSNSAGEKANLLGAGPVPADLAQRLDAVEQGYQKEVNAARSAEQEEASLQRQLTQVMDTERKARLAASQKAHAEEKELDENANRAFVNGFKSAWGQAITDFRTKVQEVEDRWNSVFRAGSQLSSIGGQLTIFSAALTALGVKLTTSAGDFDFWSRRTVAAAQAANAELNTAFGGTQQQTLTSFNDHILEMGRSLGTLKPEEVAQSFYLYQAAVGTVIKSEADLVQSQEGVQSILKAAIISDTNYETAIRGVTQAMAEYGLGADKVGYATAVMLNLTQTSQAEFSDVLEAYKMVGPQAARLGIDLAETSAVMARLSDNGIRGSAAGRAFAMTLSTILDPSDKANDALQDLFVTQQHLTGSWRDIVFAGGEFMGMLDKTDQQGQVHLGFLHEFAQATEHKTEVERQSYIAQIFSQNAAKILIPLIGEYTDVMNSGSAATATGKKRMEELAAEFENITKQASLFGDQWQIVSESIKVRLGKATYGIQEALVRLGFVVAETFLPLMEWLNKAVNGFVEFGNTHPGIVKGIVSIGAALAVLAAVAGPVLLVMGQVLQLVASWKIASTVIAESTNIFAVGLRGMGVSLAGLAGPLLIIAAIVGALYLAWKTNFLGMGEVLGQFFGALTGELSAAADIVEGFIALLGAIFSGDPEAMRAAGHKMAVAFLEAFLVLPGQMADALGSVSTTLANWAGDTMGSLAEGMVVWGYNLMMSLVNGIYEGAQEVWAAAESVAEGIAMYFRSFSPPKHGPLQGIFVWGRNLIGTLVEGMTTADISAVDEIAGKIGTALKLSIEEGSTGAENYVATMVEANGKISEMIGIVKEGGRVNADFFDGLQGSLGGWYDQVVSIALAYQDVYAAQLSLDREKEKLEVIKAQRAELDLSNKARQEAFDEVLGKNSAENPLNPAVAGQMVDPTSDAGKAEIEKMRRSLSKEDFQNWINFQSKLWDQQHDTQDKALATQEDAQNVAVTALTKQLELAKSQYDYFVKIFEYAQKMLDLQKEQDALEKKDEAKGKEKVSPYGTPEDLAAAKGDIAKVVGADTVILDEGKLTDNRGGDQIGALTDATKQKDAEQARMDALTALDRKKRSDFESQLINATSEGERQRIKQQKDAWDAAYKDEKATLQERLQFAKDVEEAATKAVDLSKAGREANKEAEYQQTIKDLLGEQAVEIKDANALKAESKDLNEAEVKAKEQQQDADHQVADLRALDKQKQLEFEQKIREAGKDPDAVRRIKEEKEAWDTSYKSALATALARSEAAKRVAQDLQNEDSAAAAAKGAKGPKGYQPIDFPEGGTGPVGAPEMPQWLKDLKDKPPAVPKAPEAPRKTTLEAEGMFDNLKRAIGFLGDKSVDSTKKVSLLADAVKETFGWKTWEDALAPEETREKVKKAFEPTIKAVTDLFGTENPNSITNQAGRGLTKVGDWFADTFGTDKPNSVTNQTARGLKAVGDWFQDTFGTDAPNSITNKVDRGLKKVNQWFSEAFELEQPNSVANRVGRGLSKVQEWFADTFGTENPNSITNQAGRGLKKVGDWFTQTFSPDDPRSVPAATGRGLAKVGEWFQDTFGVDNPNSVTNKTGRGLTKVGEWFSDTFGTEKPNSVTNQAGRGLKKVGDFFAQALDTTDPNSIVSRTGRGLEVIKGIFKMAFGVEDANSIPNRVDRGIEAVKSLWSAFFNGDDPNSLVSTVKRGWGKVADAVGAAFTGEDSIISQAQSGLRDLGRAIMNYFSNLNPFRDSHHDEEEPAKKDDGSHAGGLDYVPKDGYRAELHRGERVLTATEAVLYRSLEKLGAMKNLAANATTRAAQVTAPQVNNSVRGGDKTVNLNVARVDATNPDEGRALLAKLAFLS